LLAAPVVSARLVEAGAPGAVLEDVAGEGAVDELAVGSIADSHLDAALRATSPRWGEGGW